MFQSVHIKDLIVPALIFLGASLIFLGCMAGVIFQRMRVAAARRWPVTQGTVLKSWVSEQRDDTTDYRPRVTYRYNVGGQAYTNDLIAFGERYSSGGGSSDETKAQAVVARYPVGAQIQVYYNPQRPDDSVLEVRSVAVSVYIIVGVLFFVLGLFAAGLVLIVNVT